MQTWQNMKEDDRHFLHFYCYSKLDNNKLCLFCIITIRTVVLLLLPSNIAIIFSFIYIIILLKA